MKIIHIFKDGKMDEINISDKRLNEKKLIKHFNKLSKSQGCGLIKKLYTWDYEDNKIICYGWYDGEDGFENIHDLPSGGNSDFIEEDSLFKKIYGDIFILKSINSNYQDINISDYSVFYSSKYEDYNDYDYENENIEEIIHSDEENDDNLIEDYEIINNCLNELEYDNNDYS
jgi:hypothetical protein